MRNFESVPDEAIAAWGYAPWFRYLSESVVLKTFHTTGTFDDRFAKYVYRKTMESAFVNLYKEKI